MSHENPFAKYKGTDQPAHLRSLISTFVVRISESIISILAKFKFLRHLIVFVAVQAGLSVTRSYR